MGIRLIFLSLVVVTNAESCTCLMDCVCSLGVPGNSSTDKTVPQTDTGGLVEHTKALERTMLKELGKIPSYLRKKRDPSLGNQWRVAQTWG